MNKLSKILLISQLAIFSSTSFCQASSLWEKAKDTVSDTTNKVVDTVNTDTKTRAHERQEIDNNAQKALSRLLRESQKAKELYGKAAGYAVFDSREFAFLIKTGFGSGVAVNKQIMHEPI